MKLLIENFMKKYQSFTVELLSYRLICRFKLIQKNFKIYFEIYYLHLNLKMEVNNSLIYEWY